MYKVVSIVLCLATLFLFCPGSANHALAQEPPGEVERIVVTGSRDRPVYFEYNPEEGTYREFSNKSESTQAARGLQKLMRYCMKEGESQSDWLGRAMSLYVKDFSASPAIVLACREAVTANSDDAAQGMMVSTAPACPK